MRNAYLRLAEAEPGRIKVVQTNRPVEETHEHVKEIVAALKNCGFNARAPE